MKIQYTLALLMSLSACGTTTIPSAPVAQDVVPEAPKDMTPLVSFASDVDGHKFFIKKPKTPTSGKKQWVWYAPSFAYGTPLRDQVGYYFDQMSDAGITVVGIDVGESYGSIKGRDIFESFYQYLQTQGFEEQGCMILQSRGGLMGYNWLMDHPGRVKCVAGIYPLLTVTDYIGVKDMAWNWDVDAAWLQASLTTQSPLERHQALQGVNIFHLHGDADGVVHLNNDQAFVSNLDNGKITVVPGQGHEYYTPEFFHSQAIVDFLKANLK